MARTKANFKRKVMKSMGIGKYKRKGKLSTKGKVTVKKVQAMINTGSEQKCTTFQNSFVVTNFQTTSTTNLTGSKITRLAGFPDVGDFSFQRDGKVMKNCKFVFTIRVSQYNWGIRATPIASDNIPYHIWRVIVFVSKSTEDPTVGLVDFFRVSDAAIPIDILPINRNKITVLFDKVVRSKNNTYQPAVINQPTSEVAHAIQNQKVFQVRRRWKTLSFADNVTTTPVKASAQTYIAVLPYNVMADNALSLGRVHIRSVIYFQD